jgi:hypothetical protein
MIDVDDQYADARREGLLEEAAFYTGMMAAACIVCGRTLAGRHADARTCSAACRREASRFRAVLAGRGDGPYRTLADLNQRARIGVQTAVSGRYDAAT